MSNAKTPSGSGNGSGRPPLVLIAGPTASGKSDLAVKVALEAQARGQGAVVINADSAQVYADLTVLSARPTPGEMQGIEHRLFGTWDGAQACSAADWAEAAKAEVCRAHAAGVLPVLVGGTGLYIRTLLEGIAPVPPVDPGIRTQVRAMAQGEAHNALAREDPERAAALSPNDAARTARALEVVRSTGRTLAHWQADRVGGIGGEIDLGPLILLPDRAMLYTRCDARFGAMLESGAIPEVETLLARGLDPALPVMRAIGVREIAGYLQGEWPLDEARARGAQATRNYAKRQFTWFRHQHPSDWPRVTSENIDIASIIEILLLF